MSGADRYRVAERLEQEALDDRLLVYDPNGGQVVELNASAALVVQLCDGERTIGEIESLIAGAYPDSADSIADDVSAVVKRLADDGVLEAL